MTADEIWTDVDCCGRHPFFLCGFVCPQVNFRDLPVGFLCFCSDSVDRQHELCGTKTRCARISVRLVLLVLRIPPGLPIGRTSTGSA